MPRLLLKKLVSYIILAAVIVGFVILAGCAALGKGGPTPKDLMDHSGKLAGGFLASFATGNPLPAIMQSASFLGWIFGGASTAVAISKKKQLSKRNEPWTAEQRAAYRASHAGKNAPPLQAAFPAPTTSAPQNAFLAAVNGGGGGANNGDDSPLLKAA